MERQWKTFSFPPLALCVHPLFVQNVCECTWKLTIKLFEQKHQVAVIPPELQRMQPTQYTLSGNGFTGGLMFKDLSPIILTQLLGHLACTRCQGSYQELSGATSCLDCKEAARWCSNGDYSFFFLYVTKNVKCCQAGEARERLTMEKRIKKLTGNMLS